MLGWLIIYYILGASMLLKKIPIYRESMSKDLVVSHYNFLVVKWMFVSVLVLKYVHGPSLEILHPTSTFIDYNFVRSILK